MCMSSCKLFIFCSEFNQNLDELQDFIVNRKYEILFPILIAINLALGKAEMEGVYILSSGIYWSYGSLCYKSQYPLNTSFPTKRIEQASLVFLTSWTCGRGVLGPNTCIENVRNCVVVYNVHFIGYGLDDRGIVVRFLSGAKCIDVVHSSARQPWAHPVSYRVGLADGGGGL
jgi:hypothetical protein